MTGRKTSQGFQDIGVGHLQRFFTGLSDDHIGSDAGRGDSGAASVSLELRIGDHAFIVHLDGRSGSYPRRPGFQKGAYAGGVFDFAYIVRIHEMIDYRIIVHCHFIYQPFFSEIVDGFSESFCNLFYLIYCIVWCLPS